VTLLPELAISTENRRGQLRIRPLGSRGPGRTIGLVWRRATPLAPALRGVAASIKRVYTRLEKVAGNRSYAVARER
jgi:LysR family hydrogen peroxide-inducible transcriptional activator